MTETLAGSTPDKDARTWAMLAHFSGPAAAVLTAGSLAFIGPLIIWLAKGKDTPFAAQQAKEALNFHITVTVLAFLIGIVGFFLTVITLGLALVFVLPALMGLVIGAFVLGVIGGLEANRGVAYRYPFAFRLIA